FTQQVPRQQGVREREQLFECPPLLRRGPRESLARETLEHHIQLLHSAAAAPPQAPCLGVQRPGGGWLRVARGAHVQLCRSSSIFLISAIARAGFRSFGHTSVQFPIVWQRESRRGASSSSSRSPPASS